MGAKKTERNQTIVKLLENHSLAEVAKVVKLSKQRVGQIADDMGLDFSERTGGVKREKLYKSGKLGTMRDVDLAEEFGVSHMTVANARKYYGIPKYIEPIGCQNDEKDPYMTVEGYRKLCKNCYGRYLYWKDKDKDRIQFAKIEDFTSKLDIKRLTREADNRDASDGEISVQIAEEVDRNEVLIEGASKTISVNVFERNPTARSKCLAHYGYKCTVCSFDFEEFYGSIGQSFIHVHHIVPLSETGGEYELDPVKDLVPVCPNCHAMIHRTRPILTIAQLKAHLKAKNA